MSLCKPWPNRSTANTISAPMSRNAKLRSVTQSVKPPPLPLPFALLEPVFPLAVGLFDEENVEDVEDA